MRTNSANEVSGARSRKGDVGGAVGGHGYGGGAVACIIIRSGHFCYVVVAGDKVEDEDIAGGEGLGGCPGGVKGGWGGNSPASAVANRMTSLCL